MLNSDIDRTNGKGMSKMANIREYKTHYKLNKRLSMKYEIRYPCICRCPTTIMIANV